MFLERRRVSRKTPGDGRLEITRDAARPLRALPAEFDVEVNGASGVGRVAEMPCTCRGEGERHVHYFLESELLKALPVGGEVSLDLREGAGVVAVASV